jgi:hypothetical protein
VSGRWRRCLGSRFGHRRDSLRRRFNCCRRRRGGRSPGRCRRRARRQQGQRIDVSLRIARHARSEVHVRLRQLGHAARPNGPNHRSFSHEGPAHHSDRPEVDEGGGVSERRLDRHRLAAGRHGPGKGHDSVRGSEYRATAGSAEIDAAVLAAGIGMRIVERKRPQHRAVDGPRPGASAGDGKRTRANEQDRKSPHRFPPCCQF